MKPTIFLALSHDWELRGDGSGDIEHIQFAPMRELLQIYAKCGARTTFLPDVMQQLTFRRLQSRHSELGLLADSWDEHVREAFRRGHDIQLHLHPQWHDARYANGGWVLDGDWSIVKYDAESARAMVEDCKAYLESLLQPMDRNYRCIAFRAGALAAAPSDHLFSSLISIGIRLDVSIAPGLVVNDANLTLDYSRCEEAFLPYYPLVKDARRVSREREPIICVPLNHFYGSRRAVTKQNISLVRERISRDINRANSSQKISEKTNRESRLQLAFDKLIKPALKPKYFVSDTGRLDYALMCEMVESIRKRALESGLAKLPIVLTNHPKDIRDWAGIERFTSEISEADDIECITLAQMSEKLLSGEFQIRIAA